MMITKIFDREKRQRKKERQASHRWDGRHIELTANRIIDFYTIQIVSKQLYINKQEHYSVSVAKFLN